MSGGSPLTSIVIPREGVERHGEYPFVEHPVEVVIPREGVESGCEVEPAAENVRDE
jgi:hypothetical protein